MKALAIPSQTVGCHTCGDSQVHHLAVDASGSKQVWFCITDYDEAARDGLWRASPAQCPGCMCTDSNIHTGALGEPHVRHCLGCDGYFSHDCTDAQAALVVNLYEWCECERSVALTGDGDIRVAVSTLTYFDLTMTPSGAAREGRQRSHGWRCDSCGRIAQTG